MHSYSITNPFCGTLAFSFASNVSFVDSVTVLENKTDFENFVWVLQTLFMVEVKSENERVKNFLRH